MSGYDRRALTRDARIWERRWAGWLVVAIAVAVFAPTLVFGRVGFDDMWLWGDDSPLREASLATLREIFGQLDGEARRRFGAEYLPVRDVAVMLDMVVWGENERGPHATQLALYAISVYATGSLLVRFGLARPVAWVGTLLWAIHPVHVEAVAWLSERKGILAGLFVIACGHAWVRYRAGASRWWLVAATVAAVAGVWSKAPAMFAPAVFAAWDLLLLAKHRRRWIAIGVIGGAVALAAVPVVAIAADRDIIGDDAEKHPRVSTAVGAIGHYAQSFVLAKEPTLAYPMQTDGPSALDITLGVVVLAATLAFAWRWWRGRRDRWALALVAWAAVWFVPISHVIISVHIPVADRYVYLLSLAPCVGVALVLERLPGTVRFATTGALVCVLAIFTIRAEGVWASSLTLFEHTFATNPRDDRHVQNYVDALVAEGQHEKALAALDEALALRPGHGYLLAKKASVLDSMGRKDEAIATSALAAASGKSSVMFAHAVRLRGRDRTAEALVWIDRAVVQQPDIEMYTRAKGEILVELGRYAEAEPVLRRALALDARPPITHLLLATALVRLGRGAEATPHLEHAARDRALAAKVAALRGEVP